VLADTAGRRASFLLSTLVIAAGTLLCVALAAVEAGLVAFCLASVLGLVAGAVYVATI
jgi:MFS family permease